MALKTESESIRLQITIMKADLKTIKLAEKAESCIKMANYTKAIL